MNAVEQIQHEIKRSIAQALIKAQLVEEANIPEIILETPRSKENGDYATNIAMQLTKLAKKPPRAIAEAIVEHLDTTEHCNRHDRNCRTWFHQYPFKNRLS